MVNDSPLVCICIPCYNCEKTIAETLSSALKQSYPNFVVKILDNASTDRTLEIVEAFKDPRVLIYRSEKNIGAAGNFDRCIEMGEGKYTEIFHSDEVYESTLLAKQVDVLERNEDIGVVFTEAFLIDTESKVFGQTVVSKYLCEPRDSVVSYTYDELFPIVLRSGNFLLCSGALVRTDIYKHEIKVWRADLFLTSCDLDVWLRILEKHKVGFILENLMRTRTSQTQASYLELKRNTNRADMFLVLDHYLEKSWSKGIIKNSDMVGYQTLQRMDVARRAMNFYLMGKFGECSKLLKGHFDFALLLSAFRSKRGLLTFLLMGYLRTVQLLGFDKIGNQILKTVVVKTKR